MPAVRVKYNTPTLLFSEDGRPTHLLHSVYGLVGNETVYFVFDTAGNLVAWRRTPPAGVYIRILFTDQLLPLSEWVPLRGAPVEHCGCNRRDHVALALSANDARAALSGRPAQATTDGRTVIDRVVNSTKFLADLIKDLEMPTPPSFFDDTLEMCANGHTFSLYHQMCSGSECKRIVCPHEGCDQIIPIAAYQHIMETLSPTLHPFLVKTTERQTMAS
jgi:hypothetical protein